jgi:hypothetical protein
MDLTVRGWRSILHGSAISRSRDAGTVSDLERLIIYAWWMSRAWVEVIATGLVGGATALGLNLVTSLSTLPVVAIATVVGLLSVPLVRSARRVFRSNPEDNRKPAESEKPRS